jgi:uncharacterized protein DUF4345
MPKLYFIVNGALYLILAGLCSVRHTSTARGTGFVELNASGHSEYLVIYGGLQLGLAAFYFFLARDPANARLGLIFSLMLYAPIVLYRLTTLALYRPSNPVTLGTAALEVILLIWACLAWRGL